METIEIVFLVFIGVVALILILIYFGSPRLSREEFEKRDEFCKYQSQVESIATENAFRRKIQKETQE